MNWSKYTVENRFISSTAVVAAILIFISIYMQSYMVFFLSIFFLLIVAVNHHFLKKAGVGLSFENKLEKKHFFIEEKGKWNLTFLNEGYPILKGDLIVYFDEYVAPSDVSAEPKRSKYEVVVPVSLFKNQRKKITIPFRTEKRGVARIRGMEFHIPSLIGFGKVVLQYTPVIMQEAVVYPRRIPVKGLKEKISHTLGTHTVPFSVFEDRLAPIGTRDYLPTDSFNRIHWKASARRQTLQTKIFERIAEKDWLVTLNVADGLAYHKRLEQLISSVAEFAYFAAARNIKYSLCVNVKMAGSTPFLFIPKGEGKEHLQRVLTALASINLLPAYSYDKMLSFLVKQFATTAFYLHAGKKDHRIETILFKFGNNGAHLFELEVDEEFGTLTTMDFHKERRMTL